RARTLERCHNTESGPRSTMRHLTVHRSPLPVPTILLLEPIHPEAHAELAAVGRVVQARDDAEALRLAEAEAIAAILTRGRGEVRARLIAACPALQVIGRAGVGLDNVDVDA